MSYILDALRRLEKDKERTRRGANPVEAVMVPDFEEPESQDRRRFWWAGMGAVLLAVVIGATYWITRQTLVSPIDKAREESSPRVSSLLPQEDRPAPPSFRHESSAPSHHRPSVDERSLGSGIWSTLATSGGPTPPSPHRRPAGVRAPPAPESEPSPIAVQEEDTPAASYVEDPPVQQRNGVAVSREPSEDEAIQAWTGTEIKINAIAYSRDRNNRFAVVNLKTIHEGDQVEGLSVVEIEENGIVLEQAGTKYRVSLGKR